MNEITKELLDALKHCQNVFMSYGIDRIDGDEISDKALEIINAAIAKAEVILAAPQPSADAALAATQSDDGWIPWAGGERPVDTIVEVKLRNGGIIMNFACTYDWRHINDPVDIVAYRVVKP